jgi:hypothetical protein
VGRRCLINKAFTAKAPVTFINIDIPMAFYRTPHQAYGLQTASGAASEHRQAVS